MRYKSLLGQKRQARKQKFFKWIVRGNRERCHPFTSEPLFHLLGVDKYHLIDSEINDILLPLRQNPIFSGCYHVSGTVTVFRKPAHPLPVYRMQGKKIRLCTYEPMNSFFAVKCFLIGHNAIHNAMIPTRHSVTPWMAG